MSDRLDAFKKLRGHAYDDNARGVNTRTDFSYRNNDVVYDIFEYVVNSFSYIYMEIIKIQLRRTAVFPSSLGGAHGYDGRENFSKQSVTFFFFLVN